MLRAKYNVKKIPLSRKLRWEISDMLISLSESFENMSSNFQFCLNQEDLLHIFQRLSSLSFEVKSEPVWNEYATPSPVLMR